MTERGENVLQTEMFDLRSFSNTALSRAGSGLRWGLPAARDLNITDPNFPGLLTATRYTGRTTLEAVSAPLPQFVRDNWFDAVRMQFNGLNDPGDALILDGFASVVQAQRSQLFYFSVWVFSSQDMYMEVSVDGSDLTVFDLGRRFFVPANAWTEVGFNPATESYPIFRTNATISEDVRETQYLYSSAAKGAPTNNNDNIGNPFMTVSGAGGWTALKLTTHSASTGGARPEDNAGFTAGGHYFMTAPRLWVGEFVDKSELNEMILEYLALWNIRSQFLTDTWTAYANAIFDGWDDVLDDPAATLQEVLDAVDRIALARAQLVRRYPRDALNAVLAQARQLTRQDFANDWDWTRLQNAIESGERVAELMTLPGAALEDAIDYLNQAMSATVPRRGGCGGGEVGAGLLLLIPLAFITLRRKK